MHGSFQPGISKKPFKKLVFNSCNRHELSFYSKIKVSVPIQYNPPLTLDARTVKRSRYHTWEIFNLITSTFSITTNENLSGVYIRFAKSKETKAKKGIKQGHFASKTACLNPSRRQKKRTRRE